MHRAATCTVRTLTLNSPITNYTKDEISESGITELDLTDEVIEKYSEMANIAPKAITEIHAPLQMSIPNIIHILILMKTESLIWVLSHR